MKADVLDVSTAQDDFGTIERTWSVDRTINCDARGIIGGGIRVVGSTEEFKRDYEDTEWVKMKVAPSEVESGTMITKRFRISNIRRSDDGVVVWKDDAGNPVVFDVMGVTPYIDPFGNVTEYELLLKGVTDD